MIKWTAAGSGIFLLVSLAGGCAHTPKSDPALAKPAVEALRDARFTEAQEQARNVLMKDGKNAQAHVVLALTRYKAAGEQAIFEGGGHFEDIFRGKPEAFARARQVVVDLEAALGRVEEDLAIASADKSFAMELCLACWKVDWNHNGRIDRRDERLFQIEQDANGEKYEDEDPRRKPTFRFDVGDLHWARAMISFQRGLIDMVLVYWGTSFDWAQMKTQQRWKLPVADRARAEAAQQRFLEALAQSDASRVAYLAETDDDREWVPNPRQQNHPMPLPIDEKLYQTWATLLGDVRRMLKGEEGLDLGAFYRVVEPRERPGHPAPTGFLNLGAWVAKPTDLDLDLNALDHAEKDPNSALKTFFGPAYVPTMKSSPILTNLTRIHDEIKTGKESFERKLRYFFWIN